MISRNVSLRRPPWLYIPVRVLLVTFLLTLLSFAVSLMLGILGTVIAARLRGSHPNMTNAYRYVAVPIAAVVGAVVLISMIVLEVRRYQRDKALTAIERSS
jgi:uncharacterized membrane protein YeaQ/YmgE (transglycosylase-associated protein family)